MEEAESQDRNMSGRDRGRRGEAGRASVFVQALICIVDGATERIRESAQGLHVLVT